MQKILTGLFALLTVTLGVSTAMADAKPEPANASWALVLDKTIDEKPLNLYLASVDGTIKQSAAQGYNVALHTVDAAGLKLEGAALKGTVKITILPDGFLPKDKNPVALELQIDATATDAEVKGTFKGKSGDKEVSGTITGKLSPAVAILEKGNFDLVLWNSLVDGAQYLRDARVTFTVNDGAAKDATIAWRKKDTFHWTGKVDGIETKFDKGTFTATINSTINSGSAVIGGKYTFTLSGTIIGDFVSGSVKVQIDGKERKTSHFFGSLTGAKYNAAP